MSTSVIDSIDTDAWVEEWDRLFKLSPKKTFKWSKRILERAEDETEYHYFVRLMLSELTSLAMRALGQRSCKPVLEDLSLHLLFEYQGAQKRSQDRSGARIGKGPSDALVVAERCTKAAGWALENFDPAKNREIQENARRAGSVIKYGLPQLLDTAHLNPTAAARQLGCSRQTVYNLRSHYQDILDLGTGEVFDEANL